MRIVLALILALAAAGSALIGSAARSDFLDRGCPDIARSEWGETLNCADGWLGQVIFGGAAAMCLGLALAALIWRRRQGKQAA